MATPEDLNDAIRRRVAEVLDRPEDMQSTIALGSVAGGPGMRSLIAIVTDPGTGSRLLIQAMENARGSVDIGDVMLRPEQAAWLGAQLVPARAPAPKRTTGTE